MDHELLLKILAGTLDSSVQVRKQSEDQIRVYEQQPGFTSYLLEFVNDEKTQFGIKLSAAILFKNRIFDFWVIPETKSNGSSYIKDQEKPIIKEKLIQSIILNYKNPQLKLQLSTSLNRILSYDKWEEILQIIIKLLQDRSNIDHIYTGLICLFEYTKNYRWVGLETSNSSNPIFEEISNEVFPILIDLTNDLIENDSVQADEMLYLVIKTFKFITFSTIPTYFQDQTNLGSWCGIFTTIIHKPLPSYVLQQDSLEARSNTPRVKSVKWCFGNLHRLLAKHGGGATTKDRSTEFVNLFLQNFVPEILKTYWEVIEKWSNKSIWLSEGSLFHLISFIEQLIITPAYSLISDKLEAIIKHLILPTLNATEETIELYEDDSDEYIRRFFDINRDGNTSDVASVNFFLRLSTKKFKSTINLVMSILNDIFTRRSNNRNDISIAKEVEGAFRVLSTVSIKLASPQSPLIDQLDNIMHTFIYPELSEETISVTPWLTARACDTIAMFNHKYNDPQVLRDIFEGIIKCFQKEDQFPIQITAVDALCTLVGDDSVADHIADQAPQLMGTLLDMSKNFESDILSTVMEIFVEKFAKNLEPYATQLAAKLAEQFLRLATELLEQSNSEEYNTEKEYQAAGHLNTLGTLVRAMSQSETASLSLETAVQDVVKFVLENAQISFLGETMEILELIVLCSKNVSPTMWELFKVCIDAFDTYAFEYFDIFIPFFQRMINSGFTNSEITLESPYVQSLINVCYNILNQENVDPIFADKAFELLELIILAMGSRFIQILPIFLPQIYDIFCTLESQDAFDGFMLHHLSILKVLFSTIYIDAYTTIKFLEEKRFIAGFYKLWLKHSEDFQSVYGCKLQILASLALLNPQVLSLIPEDLISETVDLLLSNISAVPVAIKARNEILEKEISFKHSNAEVTGDEDEDDYADAYYEDELEADEAELDALRETPIDGLNIFSVAATQFIHLQQDQTQFRSLFGDISEDKQKMMNDLIEITREHK
jgi:hypothetical protein